MQTTSAPKYQIEFPDFGELDVTLPPGFVDISWHNDAMPSFRRPIGKPEDAMEIEVWINYANKEKSRLGHYEQEDYKRFNAVIMKADIQFGTDYVSTNDWREVLAFIGAHCDSKIEKCYDPEFGEYCIMTDDMAIVDATMSECGRFQVHPSEWGISEDDAALLAMLNKFRMNRDQKTRQRNRNRMPPNIASLKCRRSGHASSCAACSKLPKSSMQRSPTKWSAPAMHMMIW